MTIFLTADQHFGHHNIIKLCNRPFIDVNMMTETMIKCWNEVVKPEDEIYQLGDFAYKLNDKAKLHWIFSRLHGTKHLIVGNHDGQDVLDLPWASIKDSATINNSGIKCVLYHYPILEWDGFFHDAYHFYGHVHGNLKGYCRSMDVGVDCHNFYPISLEYAVSQLMHRKNEHRK